VVETLRYRRFLGAEIWSVPARHGLVRKTAAD
jgi:hypothetical protein